MFSKDKIKIWFVQSFRALWFQLVFWALALLFFVFITGNDSLFVNYLNVLSIQSVYANITLHSVAIACVYAMLDMFLFSDRLMRIMPIKIVALFRYLLSLLLAFLVVYIADNQSLNLLKIKSYDDFLVHMPSVNLDVIRFGVYFFLASVFNQVYLQMFKKIGRSNLLSFLMGFMNKPHEQRRIFMFIDMKSSTTIAEKLNHKKFSQLVQDVFNDLAIVDNYHGEIYQYLGDGAIVSWSLKKGLKDSNCIKAFYAVSKVVERRARYYKRRYGLVPAFKAGLHLGETMVLQVGRVRRDISYNGDTMNTTARIESMCNEHKADMLISGVLFESLPKQSKFLYKEVGNLKLKGKAKAVQVYKVSEFAKK